MRHPRVRVTVGQVMSVVALVAANLAVARATPWEILVFPSIWIILGAIDFVALWKVILRRSLRGCHYTGLIVTVVAFFVMAYLVSTERFRPLSPLVRGYQYLAVEETDTISLSRGWLDIGEFWMACFLSLALGCGAGWAAAWLERRRGWDIAAFFRGALLGYALAGLLATIDGALWGWMVESRGRLIGRLVLLGVCTILGGLMGLSRLKSTTPGPEVQGVGVRGHRRRSRL